jgi:hypothetical protein
MSREPRGSIKLGSNCPLRFCTLHTNEITHTDASVQVDYVRVVDLDIGANKSDICAIRVASISERAGNSNLLQWLILEWFWKTLSLLVVGQLIAKQQHQGPGFESLPRYAFPRFRTSTYECRCGGGR